VQQRTRSSALNRRWRVPTLPRKHRATASTASAAIINNSSSNHARTSLSLSRLVHCHCSFVNNIRYVGSLLGRRFKPKFHCLRLTLTLVAFSCTPYCGFGVNFCHCPQGSGGLMFSSEFLRATASTVGTAEARISYGNSVCLSACLTVTTRYGFKPR